MKYLLNIETARNIDGKLPTTQLTQSGGSFKNAVHVGHRNLCEMEMIASILSFAGLLLHWYSGTSGHLCGQLWYRDKVQHRTHEDCQGQL